MAALKNRVAQLEEELRDMEKEKNRASEQSTRLTAENQLLKEQQTKQVRERGVVHQKAGPFSLSCTNLSFP